MNEPSNGAEWRGICGEDGCDRTDEDPANAALLSGEEIKTVPRGESIAAVAAAIEPLGIGALLGVAGTLGAALTA